MTSRTTRILIPLGLALMTGCFSQITGNQGNFEFSYWADDKVTDFNKPVAVGAYLYLEVRDAGQHQPVDLSTAGFDDQGVLTVVEFENHQITIHAHNDGQTLLSVEGTTTGGEVLGDSVNMQAATAEVLKLHHTCIGTDTAKVLTGQRIWVHFEMERQNGQPVIGWGYYPLILSSEAAYLNVADSSQQYIAFDTATTAGALQLLSSIDDTTLTMDVVAPQDIDGVGEPIAFVLEDIDVGDTNAFYVLPSSGGAPICQANVTKTVQSDTPTICEVRDREPEDDGSDASYEFGWFEIEGLAAGTCKYTVIYPDGNGGLGTSAQFTYEIQP